MADMNRRQALKAIVAVPVAVATGAVVARDVRWLGIDYGSQPSRTVTLEHWQRELLDNIVMTDSKRWIISTSRRMGKQHTWSAIQSTAHEWLK